MIFTRRQIAVLFVSAFAIFAVAAGGASAALVYDSTSASTDTTTTSDWTGGETVTDLDNSSKDARLEVQSDNATSGDNFLLKFVVNDSDSPQNNETIYEDTSSWTATNSTNGNYELNVTHSEAFDELERDAGANYTVDVVTVWNATESDEEMATIQIYAQNGDDVRLIAGDGVELQETGGFFSSFAFWSSSDDEPEAARLEKTIGVNGNTSTVDIAEANSNVSEALDEATAETSSGDFMTHSYVIMNGHLIPVFDQSADADWLDTDERAYGVADASSGTITVKNANDTFDADTTEVDVVVAANAEPSFRNQRSMLSDYGAPLGQQVLLPSVGETFEESSL